MAKNPFFNFNHHSSEQTLHEDLIIESIKIYGLDFIYIVRNEKDTKLLYGENPLSVFDDTFEIEMYLSSVDGFEGDKKVFSNMGFETRDSARLMVAKRRFHKEMPNKLLRPREGDLLFFPLDGSLHEIHLVDDEEIFYQLGNLPVYTLSIEKYEYSHEDFDTTYEIIDEINKEFKYSYELQIDNINGTFETDDIIFQGSTLEDSTASAKVHSFDSDNNLLRIYKIKGEFTPGVINVFNSTSNFEIVASEPLDIKQDTNTDNKTLEDSGKQIYDFSEKDPFSDGEY